MIKTLKNHIPDIVMIVLFAVLSFGYFFPADTEGRILYQHDASAGRGAGEELREFAQQTGERSRWTNALFGGMPTYQSAPSYDSVSTLSAVTNAYHLWLPNYVWYLFAYLLGFYILLRAFDFKWYLAGLGSVIWALSSYFLIIIAAGHIWKVMALAYLPPMIAGVVLCYRKKYLSGFVVTALFSAMEVLANHVQMTYYYLFIIMLMVIAYLVEAIRNKSVVDFFKSSAVCAVAAMIGVLMNISNLYHTWEYQKESMRGKSELVKKDSKDAANQTSSGLDRDYITQWSYGIGETWTLMIPNTKGGTSGESMANSEVAMSHANNDFIGIYQQLPQYWGEQPGTSGPVYVGAFVMMLFILSLFIVKGPMKWALLAATILSILLSWGKNFMPFTDFFLDYIPMYAKFRTVASILVIAEFTIPLLAMLGLKKVIDEPELLKTKQKSFYISFALTGGICLLFALMPTLFFSNYISEQEMQSLQQVPDEYRSQLIQNLSEMRRAMFTSDCWRSFWIISIGALSMLLYRFKKLSAGLMVGIMTVLCLYDMWQVDKRYLNDAMFVNADVRDTPQQLTETDKEILKDKSLDYRVINLASNTFNENETSYYHKSIGGYHAAKLRRYQELIEAYIAPEMQSSFKEIAEKGGNMQAVDGKKFEVINMLNTKYFILPLKDNQTMPLENPYTFGNAWYVDNVKFVDNANEELDGLGKNDLRKTAIADKQFESVLGKSAAQDSTASVKITAYKPNNLTYTADSKTGGVIVFSEIYYPGWTATIDGNDAELGRVNYVLRALNVPAGKHTIVLDFHPQSIKTTDTIAYISMGVLVLAIIAIIALEIRKAKKKEQ